MRPIIIGIDASNLSPSGLNPGTRTHLVELLSAATPDQCGVSRIVVWGGGGLLETLPVKSWLHLETGAELNGTVSRRVSWQARQLTVATRKAGCDVLFVPGGYFLGSFAPFVAMSQNLMPFETKELLRYGASPWLLKTILLRVLQVKTFQRADGLVFLTQHARDRVLKYTGPLDQPQKVIPHGINRRFACRPRVQRAIEDCSPQNPFKLVYVSAVDHYKHQWNVVKAVAMVRRRHQWPVHLTLAGSHYSHALPRLKKTLAEEDAGGSWATYCGPVPHERLPQLYAAADMAVFASSCEAFGNIVLEKMSSGLPLACSRRSAMPEILRDGGEYFDPEEPDTIARALERLIASAECREVLADKAYRYASDYSWRSCADQTLAFIRSVYDRQEAAHSSCAR
jgi:glycosyltransferase involved in cell wall biosynthesis